MRTCCTESSTERQNWLNCLQNVRATVERAKRARIVTQDQARRLVRLIEMRNRMVHDYERIAPEKVFSHLAPAVKLYREMARRLRKLARE